MDQNEDDPEGHGSPAYLSAITLGAAGKSVRLGAKSKWVRAIQNGDLEPNTVVEAAFSDGGYTTRRAGDFVELQSLFEAAGLSWAASEDGASHPPLSTQTDDSEPVNNGDGSDLGHPGGVAEHSDLPTSTTALEGSTELVGDVSEVAPDIPVAHKPGAAKADARKATLDPAAGKISDPLYRIQDGAKTPKRGGRWIVALVVGVAFVGLVRGCLGSSEDHTKPATTADAELGVQGTYYVRRNVKLRSGPSASSADEGELTRGEELFGRLELGQDGETRWLAVTKGTYAGRYVWGKNISPQQPPPFASSKSRNAIVRSAGAVYAEPDSKSTVLDTVSSGREVLILGTGPNWVEIGLRAGGVGYISRELLESEASPSATLPVERPGDPGEKRPALRESRKKPPSSAASSSGPVPPIVGDGASDRSDARNVKGNTGPVAITNPDWARRPNGDDLARFYPDRAARSGLAGSATIACLVTARGSLTDCEIVAEDPPGYGFGEATLRASRLFRMKPQTRDGRPVDGARVRIPLIWSVPE